MRSDNVNSLAALVGRELEADDLDEDNFASSESDDDDLDDVDDDDVDEVDDDEDEDEIDDDDLDDDDVDDVDDDDLDDDDDDDVDDVDDDVDELDDDDDPDEPDPDDVDVAETLFATDAADTFRFSAGTELERVVGFSAAGGDSLVLDPGLEYSLRQDGEDVVLHFSNGDELVLLDVDLASLTPGWVTTAPEVTFMFSGWF